MYKWRGFLHFCLNWVFVTAYSLFCLCLLYVWKYWESGFLGFFVFFLMIFIVSLMCLFTFLWGWFLESGCCWRKKADSEIGPVLASLDSQSGYQKHPSSCLGPHLPTYTPQWSCENPKERAGFLQTSPHLPGCSVMSWDCWLAMSQQATALRHQVLGGAARADDQP